MNKNYYIITGYSDDAHIYRHGDKVVNLYLETTKKQISKFWDIVGKSPYHTKWWVLALSQNSMQVIGCCMVLPHNDNNNCYVLKNFVYNDEATLNVKNDILKKAREYTDNKHLIVFTECDSEEKLASENGAIRHPSFDKENKKSYTYGMTRRRSKVNL